MRQIEPKSATSSRKWLEEIQIRLTQIQNTHTHNDDGESTTWLNS